MAMSLYSLTTFGRSVIKGQALGKLTHCDNNFVSSDWFDHKDVFLIKKFTSKSFTSSLKQSARLWGITRELVEFIPQSVLLGSIAFRMKM